MHQSELWTVTRSNGYDGFQRFLSEGVPAYKFGLSSLLNFAGNNFVNGFASVLSSNALSVSTHLCVDWRDVVFCHTCELIDLFIQAKFTQVLQLLARVLASQPAKGSSFPVMSSKHVDEIILLPSFCQHRILLWLVKRVLCGPNLINFPTFCNFLDHSSGHNLLHYFSCLWYHPSRSSQPIFQQLSNLLTTNLEHPSTILLHPFSNSRITHLDLPHLFSNLYIFPNFSESSISFFFTSFCNFRSIHLGLRHQFSHFSNCRLIFN